MKYFIFFLFAFLYNTPNYSEAQSCKILTGYYKQDNTDETWELILVYENKSKYFLLKCKEADCNEQYTFNYNYCKLSTKELKLCEIEEEQIGDDVENLVFSNCKLKNNCNGYKDIYFSKIHLFINDNERWKATFSSCP